jgi:uncharacterized protein
VNPNYAAIKAHYAASDRRDIEGMMAPVTSETCWTEMAGFPYAGTYVGVAAIVTGVFKRIAEDWESFHFALDRLVDGGNTIIGIGTYSGKYRITGLPMTARVVHVWDMEDGRVVRLEQFVDTRKVVDAIR